MLTRTESGSGRATGTVDSMLNDDSKLARVVLRGTVNGVSFVVERAVSKGATSKKKAQTSKLSLILDGKDHTQQTIRLTQDKIDSLFNCSLARSSVFFGQNDITTLLEANDADFKELLRRVVAMDVWPKARADYIKEWRAEVKQQVAKAGGQRDLLEQQQEDRRRQEQAKREQLQAWEQQQLHRMTQLRSAIAGTESETLSLVAQLDLQEEHIRSGVDSIQRLQGVLDQEVQELQAKIDRELAAPAKEATPSETIDNTAGAAAADTGAEPLPSQPSTTHHLASPTDPNNHTSHAPAPTAQPQDDDSYTANANHPQSMGRSLGQEPLPTPASSPSQALRESLLATQVLLPGLQDARDKAAQQLSKRERAVAKAETRLTHVQEGLMEWVSGLLPGDQQAKADGAVQAASVLLDPSTERTLEWLSSMSDVHPVCDKCGQQVEVAHFERRIHEMKAKIKAAQDQHNAALEQHDLACAALDGINTELLQKQSAVEECRQRYEEQAQLELQQQQEAMQAEKQAAKEREQAERRALQAEQKAFEAKQRKEQQALEAERAAFEARQRSQKESMAYCRSLEQQQLGARSAILQGHAALEALGVMRERLPESLLPERRLHASTDLLAAASSAPGTAPDTKGPGGTMQGAVLVVDLASKSAMQIVEVLGGMLTKLEQKTAELQMVQMEANPHKGQLEMLQEQLVQSECVLEETASQLASLEQRYAALEEANKALGGAGVQSYVLEGVLGNLQMLTATYMQQLANNMVLELSATKAKASSKGDGDDSMEKIDKVVKYRTPSGESRIRSLFQLSGGERRRVALALCLAFADLVKQYGRLSCNILVLDEVLQQLDQEGCIRVADLLRELPLSSVFVVGQAHSFVTEAFEKMDTVVKKDGYSTISITP